jgi:hypothetical protein
MTRLITLFREYQVPTTPSHSRVAPATRSGPPSPNLATSSAWTASGTYSGGQSPGRKLANREHARNVWTQQDQLASNSRQSDGDIALPLSSTQDVKEDPGAGERQTARNELDLDLDLPRYPTINAAPVRESDGDVDAQHTGLASTFEGDRTDLSKGYEGYQYMSLNHMGPSSSHLPSPYAARSPIDGMSAAAQQQGVWMPLQQAANGPYSSGISNTGSPIYGMHNMSKSPGKCKTRQRKAKSSS